MFPWAMGVDREFFIILPTSGWRERCSRNESSESQQSEISFEEMMPLWDTESAPNINRVGNAYKIFTSIQPIE